MPCPQAGCSHTARSRHELAQHEAAAHSTERPHACRHPECGYAAKTAQQLARHSKIHGSRTRKFACPSCDYRTDHSAQMKRHARLHTGDKPYACPHCRFCCNSLENLRKHIFKTKKHRGKPLYQCKDCPPKGYSTNFASELRNHLVQEHGVQYNSKTAAEYVARYCMKPVDETNNEKNMDEFEDSSNSHAQENIGSPNHSNATDNEMDSRMKTSLMEGYYSVSETGTLIPFFNAS